MNTNAWGPPLWEFLHTITLNAPLKVPAEQQLVLQRFFDSIGTVLPCRYCRNSYKLFTEMFPITCFIRTRLGLAYWLYRIHDLVNVKLAKPASPPFVEVIEKYEKTRFSGPTTTREAVLRAENHYSKKWARLLRKRR